MRRRAFPEVLAIVDTETTGMRPPFSRVVDLGILRVENGTVVKKYQTLLNPGSSIPYAVSRIHGITDEMVADAPSFADVAIEVQEMLDGAVFVAHNAQFDHAFMKAEFRRLRMTFEPELLCTVQLSRALFPDVRGHSLDAIIERFNIRMEDRHRAYPDAAAVWEFLKKVQKKHPPEVIESAVAYVMGREPRMERRELGDLPQSPGVYFFYGAERELLYIGKSKNIRTRARSHFSTAAQEDEGKEHAMVGETATIEAHTTTGELSALLLENALIKKESPLYNRRDVKRKALIVAKRIQGGAAHTVVLERTAELSADPNILSIFKSMPQAKNVLHELAREYGLCERLLGIDTAGKVCFRAQLGACTFCTGGVSAVGHNALLEQAFEGSKMRAWEYKGGVIIDEKQDENVGTVFFIDNWRLVGSFRYDSGSYEEFLPRAEGFDYDAYKILTRFMRDKRNRRMIQVVPASVFTANLARAHGTDADAQTDEMSSL